MGAFKEDYDKRLRRICGITDDSLRVEEDSETVYSGYCETCYSEEKVIVVKVYDAAGKTIATKQFYDMGDLMRALDKVEL